MRGFADVRVIAFTVLALLLDTVTAASFGRRAKARANPADAGGALASSTGGMGSMTPVEFIIASSPLKKKVCFAELINFKAKNNRVLPLIDSGLQSPQGIALDKQRGYLYIADSGAKKIFRYNIVVNAKKNDKGQQEYSLATRGVRLTVVQNAQTSWVTVDSAGSIYYTDQALNSVNKVTYAVIQKLAAGDFTASSLTIESEPGLEAQDSADVNAALAATTTTAAPTPSVKPVILALYQASPNGHVSKPAGIDTSGVGSLFWANSESGMEKGSVTEGETTPTVPLQLSEGSAPSSFGTSVLASNIDNAFGVVRTYNSIIFSGQASFVYGVRKGSSTAVEISETFQKPRGLAWDGDNTVYVADEGGNAIFSFPSGRLRTGEPIERVAPFDSAFGLTVLKSTDDAFWIGGATASTSSGWALGLTLFALWSIYTPE